MGVKHHPVIILGSGPAGYTAAVYTSRANLKPVIIQGMQPGGQLTITTEVDNYPGFEEGISGPELMQRMQAQAERFGTEVIFDQASAVDLSQRPFQIKCESGDEYTSDVLIISTGASARWLGMESEEKLKGFGVSACATCDGFFFKDQVVSVIGGGDAAVEEAIFLTNFASKVYLVHRRDALRAEKIMQDRLLSNEKIEPVWDSVVEEILGEPQDGGVKALKLKNVKTGEISELATHGVFVAIGHTPNTSVFSDELKCDEGGYIITTPGSTTTSVEGVFAAGDVQDRTYRQAVTAAGSGCMAALEAERFLGAMHDEAARK